MRRLENRVALITGASGGQGIAEANLFVREGAAVVLTDVLDAQGEKLAADICRDGGRACYLHHDVSDDAGWKTVIAKARQEFGALHILVNNAGVISRQGIEHITREAWDRVISVNLTGPLLGMKYAAPLIRDSGGGSIINVSSTAGLMPHYDAAYTASKWGLRGLSKSAAIEFVDWGIRVNSIHPAQISDTGFFREGLPGHSESARRAIPMQRQGTTRECADLVLFLASDESSFITGAEIPIDGGFSSGGAEWMRRRLRHAIASEQAADSNDCTVSTQA